MDDDERSLYCSMLMSAAATSNLHGYGRQRDLVRRMDVPRQRDRVAHAAFNKLVVF